MDFKKRSLGLAVLRAFHHAASLQASTLESSYLKAAFRAGQWMAFAERLRGQPGSRRSGHHVTTLASLAGIDQLELETLALPTLKSADVLDYSVDAHGSVTGVEEYVGVTGSLLHQTADVFEACRPRVEDRAAVISGHLGAHAPMTERDHLDALLSLGIPESAATEGITAAVATRMLVRLRSQELNTTILYNEHIWSTGVVEISGFLRNLPTDERDIVLGIVDDSNARPGLALPQLASAKSLSNVNAAHRVGLIDAVTVQAGNRNQTYTFSPLMERELATRETTDALHERKLFVAHIMFGHEFGSPSTGRIDNPVVLVDRLLRSGSVGPASAISTDYALLEAFGIVRVEPVTGSRSQLHLVKQDVVQDSLELLRRGLSAGESGSATQGLESLWLPGSFTPPERNRQGIGDVGEESRELFEGLVKRLHEQAARITRDEQF